MNSRILIYILVMALVTYLIRALPLTLIRRQFKSRFLRSFLYYVPYVTLTVMTFPGILFSTGSVYSAGAGLLTALFAAYKKRSLLQVALLASAAVLAVELIQTIV